MAIRILRKRHFATQDRVGERRLAFAPLTIAFGVLGFVALWCGWHFGWIEFVTLAVFCLITVLLALLMTIGQTSYAVTLELGDEQVKVGQRAFGRIDVTNVGRRTLLPARIELPVGRARAEFTLPALKPNQNHDELFAVPTKRRAVIDVGPVRSVRADPFGLVRREVTWTDQQRLFVHPVTVALSGSSAGVLHDLEGQSSRITSDNDMNFHALREYVPGDDRRTIHWKTSARTQKLMVRQFEDTRRTHTAIVLDTSRNAWTDENSFELGVSSFASIAVQTIRDGMDRTFFTGQGELRSTTPRAFLDESAAIDFDAPDDEYLDPAQIIAREASDCSLAIVITGEVEDQTQLRDSAAALPVGARVLYVQCAVGKELSVRTRGTSSFGVLSDLSDLPRLLRLAVGI
ncbi:DUF58 domain-containing protein [Timonella sp. A28]|uniref:DUF58 domain-containing protein n=1 Tax=Timonella sp. A28 TaxID=3442640 RepID=UPI003EB95BEF